MRSRWFHAAALGGAILIPVAGAAADDDRSPEAVRAAETLLEEVRAAYASLPALEDTVDLAISIPEMGEQQMKMTVRLGDGTDAEVTMTDFYEMTSVDGVVYIVSPMIEGQAVRRELGESPLESLYAAFDDQVSAVAAPQLVLRWSEDGDWLDVLGMGLVADAAIVGHRMSTSDDGRELHEVLLENDADGSMVIRIDPETKLLSSAVITGMPEGYPGTDPFTVNASFSPRVQDTLTPAIAFDGDGLEFSDSFGDLMMAGGGMDDIMPGIEIGAEAPTFALTDQSGEMHSLTDYRGKVVLLDWWGVW